MKMALHSLSALVWPIAVILGMVAPLRAGVQLQIDYTYDTSNFFAAGSAARSTLEAACDFYASILDDDFLGIDSDDDNQFTGYIYKPNTGVWSSLSVLDIPADKIMLYVGTRNFGGNILGQAGPGGYSISYDPYDPISFQWYVDAVTRGQGTSVADVQGLDATDFAPWGGSMSIDEDTVWNLDHTVAPAAGQADLYSVILHELGHVLGTGTADSWYNLISGSSFYGTEAMEENNATAVPVSISTDGGAHWEIDTQSSVYGSFAEQEAAMTPYITNGTRKVLTSLDVAGLDDIGWEIEQPLSAYGDANLDNSVDALDVAIMAINWLRSDATWSQGDFNGDGVVNDEDAALLAGNWLTSADVPADAVPEPGLSVLLLSMLAAACVLRPKLHCSIGA